MLPIKLSPFGINVKRLPYDREVEYLESTGTQWIDTGVIPVFNTSFEIEFVQTNSLYRFSPIAYCGQTYNSSDTFGFCINRNVDANDIVINAYYGSIYNEHLAPNNFNMGEKLNVKFRNGNTDIVLFNKSLGTTYSSSLNGTFTSGLRSLYLFNGNTTTIDLAHPSVIQLYFCQLYNGDTLVRNFIPVRTTIEGKRVGAMYDIANPNGGPNENGMYYNQGSGDFIIGPDL